ncbi:cilia- and flagella-associated protein 221 [Fundulus heteroclitus]|uniref:cilia- and flagella-associated protein 221 n=1 Tax=Fundulus heteroclitus TaxID=8078 RepID=UPI00165B8BFD|nr:cilia- and flagella-associated protein 221 [Fundulus heteroclitus]
MEVAPSGPQTLSEPHRRGTPLPLSQLVEETRSAASIPNHLLESKIYTQLNGNSQIQAEPAELHFTGFELGKNYTKILKLVNISSEVLDVHIIPTLTKHFQTTYTKKCRLIPGLAYTLKVAFCPAEWRYFYDCVRVHCKGEENLLIPVHAYPVIDDLHIPPRIDLSAVPLGQSVRHAIPLRCSCPIDFEFQVYVIQPHEAFSIHPLIGVIPANGEAKITVTFSPVRYETSQFTFQLVVSQFNTKPYLCTVTGSSSPHLALSLIPHELDRRPQDRASAPAESAGRPAPAQRPPSRKSRQSWTREADRLKPVKDQLGVQHRPPPSMAACTPAGVAKMLIRDINKLHSKDLKQALSCGSMKGKQSRQMKEALFMKKVQQAAGHIHQGMEPASEARLRQVLEEREAALHEYMVQKGDGRQEEAFAPEQTQLSSRRMLRDARQGPDGEPDFQLYTSIPWELKQRALTLFQQAARKVAIRCRVQHRLASLKELADSMENVKDQTCDFEVSLSNVFPSSFPIFSLEDNPMALRNLEALPVDPIDVTVTADIPYFKLQVPQHYKLMGYQPVSAWEAFNSYVPTTPARPLRAGAPANILCATELNAGLSEEEPAATSETARLSFSTPEALIRPLPAHPLRIFNPAPGLQTYNPQPKYLDSDLESHLCPLPGYAHRGSDASGLMTPTPHTQVLRHEETSCGIVRRRDSDSVSNESLISSPPRRSTDYNAGILPLSAPPSVAALPDDLPPLTEASCAGSGVQLTPEMIRAGFLMRNPPLAAGTRARLEVTHRSEINQMQTRLMTRLKQLEGEEREGKTAAHTHPPRE